MLERTPRPCWKNGNASRERRCRRQGIVFCFLEVVQFILSGEIEKMLSIDAKGHLAPGVGMYQT